MTTHTHVEAEASIEDVMRTLTENNCLSAHRDTGELVLTQHGQDVARLLIREQLECYFEYEKWRLANLRPDMAMVRLLTNFTNRALTTNDVKQLALLQPKQRYAADVRPPIVPWID